MSTRADDTYNAMQPFAEDDVIRKILEGTAAATGEDFFRALVKNLAAAMEAYGAFVTEYFEETDTARAIAFWTADGWIEDYRYDVAGTPCELVFKEDRFFHFADNVQEIFPRDRDFAKLRIVGYMGSPIEGRDGRVIGHLSVIDRKPLPARERCLAIFKIFAMRAAAERRRLQAEAAVRDREEKLRRLVEGAMDAIVELDGELRVTQFNAAASEIFRCKPEHALGESFLDLVAPQSQEAFRAGVASLDVGGPDRRSIWLRENFHARRGDGSVFPGEGSVSRSASESGAFYTVVLRNVEDRIRAAAKIQSLTAEASQLREELKSLGVSGEIIGESRAMKEVLRAIRQVAAADTAVLLMGETGVGKEVVARAVHAASKRASKPMVRVNCAAIPANLIESEFFGHEKGAFTGATSAREGRFSLADGGTIFLDEIGELPLPLQPKLLRVLQEGEFEPVRSSQPRRVNVRVIAATNRDLEEAVSEGAFRSDLYYRLGVFPIQIPPLRERDEDVLLLAESFCRKLAADMGKSVQPLDDEGRRLLLAYGWPGNVRELQNVIERAVLCASEGGRLDIASALPRKFVEQAGDALPGEDGVDGDDAEVLTEAAMRRLERRNIERALERCGGRISGSEGAAALLGIKPTTLSSRIKALGIAKPK